MIDIFWIEVREPRMSPVRKGPFRVKHMAATLREFMDALPGAFLTVVTVDDGEPWFEDASAMLFQLDGRSRPRCRRHRETSRRAFAEASK